MKHKQMFKADDEEAKVKQTLAVETSTSQQEPNSPINFTLSKTQLASVSVAPNRNKSVAAAQPQTSVTTNASPKRVIEKTKSGPGLTSFNSKILMRSDSSASSTVQTKEQIQKRNTVHLSSMPEEPKEADGARGYWKKIEGEATQSKTIVVASSTKRTVETAKPIKISSPTPDVKPSIFPTATQKKVVEVKPPTQTAEEVSSTAQDESTDQKSASELIKTFNSVSSPKKTDSVSSLYLKKTAGNTKSQAPQAPTKVSAQPTPVKPSTTFVPVTKNRKPGHLVKTQVFSNHSSIPPPPPLPSVLKQTPSSSHFVSSSSISFNSASYSNRMRDISPNSKYKTRQSVPINIPISASPPDPSYLEASPSDLIIPRPPSPLAHGTEIPKGVPPPPPLDVSLKIETSVMHILHHLGKR